LIIRFSTFFLLLGGALLLLFAISTQVPAKNRAYLLLAGLGLFVLGIIMRQRAPKKPPSPPARFRMLRRRKTDSNEEEDDKQC